MADDFIDFMVLGGNDLINGQKCPSCHKFIPPEEIDKADAKCPHCGEDIEVK